MRTPDDVLRFVQRYGPLRSFHSEKLTAYAAAAAYYGIEVTAPVLSVTLHKEHRERVEDILREASRLNTIIRFGVDVKRASRGDQGAQERLLSNVVRVAQQTSIVTAWTGRDDPPADRLAEEARRFKADIKHPDETIGRLVASMLSDQMLAVRPYMRLSGGQFEVPLMAETLLAHCYLAVAHALAKEPLATRPECSRVFIVDDARQRFCEPRCAARVRARKVSERKGDARGKTTRTR